MSKQLEFLIDEPSSRGRTNVTDVISLAEPVRAAEFFAGIGLVRYALEKSGVVVHWANDIEPLKQRIYQENFGSEDFHLGDLCDVKGDDIPDIDIATASFPCTDLSLAGSRRGLAGEHSGMFGNLFGSSTRWVLVSRKWFFWRTFRVSPPQTMARIFAVQFRG